MMVISMMPLPRLAKHALLVARLAQQLLPAKLAVRLTFWKAMLVFNADKLEPIAKPAPTLQVSVILVMMPFSLIQLPRNALLVPLVAKPVLPL
jgi:hypothetical protein